MTEVKRRVGHRGAILALLGSIYALIGVSYIASPLPDSSHAILRLALRYAPIEV